MYKATLKYKSFILAEYKELTLLTQKKKKRRRRKKSSEEARSKHVRGGEGHWAKEKRKEEEEAKYL